MQGDEYNSSLPDWVWFFPQIALFVFQLLPV
jgi:hypothetical protein